MNPGISKIWANLKLSSISSQKKGYAFEKVIELILEEENLEPKASYKPRGEQIDGSFFWNGQTFLLEAKWVKDSIPASSIYAFKGKLDGKFHTTSGIFLSMSGYSEDVEDVLRFGKNLNILLFLPEDIELFCSRKVTFLEILKFKIRQAGDTGAVAVPYELKDKVSEIDKMKIINKQKYDKIDLLIISEFDGDKKLIEFYLWPIVNSFEYSYKIISLNGNSNFRLIPSLISIYEENTQIKGIIVFTNNYFQPNNDSSPLFKIIQEQVENSAMSNSLKIIELTPKLRSIINENLDSGWNDVFEIPEYSETIDFLRPIKEDYEYDPIQDEIDIALKSIIENVEWDFNKKVIWNPSHDHSGHDSEINNVNDFIAELDESVTNEAMSNFPLEFIKEFDSFSLESEVRNYLLENKSKELKLMGWLNEI